MYLNILLLMMLRLKMHCNVFKCIATLYNSQKCRMRSWKLLFNLYGKKKTTGKDFALFCNKSYFPFPTEWTLDQTPWTRKLLGASSDIQCTTFLWSRHVFKTQSYTWTVLFLIYHKVKWCMVGLFKDTRWLCSLLLVLPREFP